jgi:curved DNA-binding protein CbpA
LPEARKRTPKPVPQQRDPRSLPLSPTDGFVLSRVDGALTDGDLAVSTGLPEELVLASLTKLEGLGLITFDGTAEKPRPEPTPTPDPPTAAPTAAPAPTATPTPTAPTPAPAPRAQTPFPKGAPLTPEEETALAEDVDLELDFRKAVLGKHRKLEADHYEMLGVPRNADRKAIKRAYFELAARFHPDRYFRKRLGSFKIRMEAVFAAVTTANDVLGNRDKRAEYDAYLAEQRRSRSIEDLLEAAVAEAQEAAASAEEEARAQARLQSSPNQVAIRAPGAPTVPPRTVPSQAPVPTQAPPSQSGQRPAPTEADIAARRETLARRLLGGRSRPTPMAGAAQAADAPQSRAPSAAPMGSADAMDALKRRYEERIALAKKAKSRTYIDQSDAALAKGDLLTAATSLRIAADLVPGDPELEAKAQRAREQADVILCDTYTKQAQYEETSQRWADAARSWARVCRAAPSNIDAHVRAVTAILNSRGDLHEAARLAKRACEVEPHAAKHRVMLGSVYLAAGLALNARRELDTAAQMAPQDDTIKEMIRRLSAAL